MAFTHLHVHTEFSLLDGSNKIKEYVARVKELGMNSAAITDHGVMFGVIDFYKAAKAAGINPLRDRTAAMAVTGKQINRIPFSSSCPLDSIASNIRQYMTFAVLLTGNPVNALGKGIQGGNGVSIVINSKFIRCVPPFSLLVWINNGGSQSQPPGSSACTHAGISGIIRCK